MNPINVLIAAGGIKNTGTLVTNSHKSAGESNPHVLFRYAPLTIFNHTPGEVSGSMNSGTIKMTHTNKQATK